MYGSFAGLHVITSVFMVERKQVRFPKSKKRRIRKKWAKDWNEVKTCSERCKGEFRRKRKERSEKGPAH